MSDNQSWNSSGSEEDMEPREEPGHLVGVVDLSGVLSKVSPLKTPHSSANVTAKSRGPNCQRGAWLVFTMNHDMSAGWSG